MGELFELLKSSSFCAGLTDGQIDLLVQSGLVTCATYKKNEILFRANEAPEKLYLFIEGSVVMAKEAPNGKRSLSSIISKSGDIIGEVRLFSQKRLLWEYALVLEKSTVLEISTELLLCPNAISPDIQSLLFCNIMRSVVEKADRLGQKVGVLSLGSIRERIAFYLLSIQDASHRMLLPTKREELSDFLGLARPSLSRELGRMQDEGIIRINGREVIILDDALFEGLLD